MASDVRVTRLNDGSWSKGKWWTRPIEHQGQSKTKKHETNSSIPRILMFFDHFNFHGDESEITVPQKPFQRKDAGSRTKACAFQAARTVGTAFTAESYDSILYLAEVDRYSWVPNSSPPHKGAVKGTGVRSLCGLARNSEPNNRRSHIPLETSNLHLNRTPATALTTSRNYNFGHWWNGFYALKTCSLFVPSCYRTCSAQNSTYLKAQSFSWSAHL